MKHVKHYKQLKHWSKMSFDSSNKFNSVGLGGLYLFIYKV